MKRLESITYKRNKPCEKCGGRITAIVERDTVQPYTSFGKPCYMVHEFCESDCIGKKGVAFNVMRYPLIYACFNEFLKEYTKIEYLQEYRLVNE